jgi:hypothetical protein
VKWNKYLQWAGDVLIISALFLNTPPFKIKTSVSSKHQNDRVREDGIDTASQTEITPMITNLTTEEFYLLSWLANGEPIDDSSSY